VVRYQSPLPRMALILKRASTSRPSGKWNDDDFDVLADGVVVGRITKAAALPAEADRPTPLLRAPAALTTKRGRRGARVAQRSQANYGRTR
jgi:hypothetical protein